MPSRRDPAAPARASRETNHLLPNGLEGLPWELPRVFLGLDGKQATPLGASTWILPVPYEATASWGTRTRQGPQAIIDASRYVELFDHELGRDTSGDGVYTLPALELVRGDAARAMSELDDAYGRVLRAAAGRRVIVLGGEHSISGPLISTWARRCPTRLTVLQFDAHLDLRKEFGGNPHPHACAMARVVDAVDLVAVGARGISQEEWGEACARDNVRVFTDHMCHGRDDWMPRILDSLGDVVYITFDVDYLDPSLVPSTGTPEPGGGQWHPTLALLGEVFRQRRVVGVDVVEHAPLPGVVAPDFLVAKLVYKMIGYWGAQGARPPSGEPAGTEPGAGLSQQGPRVR